MLARQLTAEALGTMLLLMVVIGSGIMGERLAGGNAALALLGNTLATGAILTVLIVLFGPVSGAHFNPCVTLAAAAGKTLRWPTAAGYIGVQILGALIGVWLAHAMFDLPVLQLSTKARTGIGQWLAEFVATFGLLLTIHGSTARAPATTAAAVGLYITAAYWFTASTSFANPAVTLARAASDTFAGIAPAGVSAFIAAQCAGTIVAAALSRWFWPPESTLPISTPPCAAAGDAAR
ncbi:MAG TPA: MIP/aquaporin family protein [Pseudolabrys sp.]|nr:MIP/aquaporin family protein [Pseudolabrys sp.]